MMDIEFVYQIDTINSNVEREKYISTIIFYLLYISRYTFYIDDSTKGSYNFDYIYQEECFCIKS